MGLFIPQKLKVGFVKRPGTFNGKLAYVIYYDEKGKLRKEKSFDSWRDTSIEVVEVDNTPASFVLNKGVTRTSYDWRNHSRTMIRIWDNRDFEFEISVDNLMGILMHSDVSKRDIQEQCVYAWDGTELVLLPINSEAYQEAVAHTQKQSMKLTAKDLVPGMKYSFKNNSGSVMYLGKYAFAEKRDKGKYLYKGLQHVFHDDSAKQRALGTTFATKSIDSLAECISPEVEQNFPEVLQKFMASKEYTYSDTACKFQSSRLAKNAKHGYLCISGLNDVYLKLTLPDTETVTYQQLLEECCSVYLMHNNKMVHEHEFRRTANAHNAWRMNDIPGWTRIVNWNQGFKAYPLENSDIDITPENVDSLNLRLKYPFESHIVYLAILSALKKEEFQSDFPAKVWKMKDVAIPVEQFRQFMQEHKFKTCYLVTKAGKTEL